MSDIIFKAKAVYSLRPGCKFVYRNDVFEWNDDESLRPSDEEILNKALELEAQVPFEKLREHRNLLLTQSDWTQVEDVQLNDEQKLAWKVYRQALRDLPETSTPVLDPSSPIGISGVDWPVKPE